MIERLREIRDKISLDIQDMSFEEMQEYFKKRREKFEIKNNDFLVEQPKEKYFTSKEMREKVEMFGKKKLQVKK